MKSLPLCLPLLLLFCGAAGARPLKHPLYGRWTWTTDAGCTEAYYYRPDGTAIVDSGEEHSESRFKVSALPDDKGYFHLIDTVVKSNGKADCAGSEHGTPVGDTARVFVLIKPSDDEMVICFAPSPSACIGPLRRTSK